MKRIHAWHCASCVAMSLLLGSCNSTPATVSRLATHANLGDPSEESCEALAELLQKALLDPTSKDSAVALGHFVEDWKKEFNSDSGTLYGSGEPGKPDITYRVRFDARGEGCYPIGYFDQLSPAEDFKIKGIKDHMRAGVGAPLSALRENKNRLPIEHHYPEEGITRAVTAVAGARTIKRDEREVTLRLLCPLRHETVTVDGKSRPLAANFSVPWALGLSRSGALKRAGVWDALLTRMPKRKPQLYLMEPYDPKKEPLIMIHGLLSTPLTFADLSNELWSVDAIRRRYQIWHFLYNTSAPALYSARMLRTQLKELRPELDPDGNDPAMQKTTLLTHSMGGVIGKALVCEPRDAYWKAALTVPHEQLKLSAEDRVTLNQAFEWKADPTIHRVIYIAVPHRGTNFADNFVGRFGRWISAPPSQFAEFYRRISKDNPGVFTPQYDAMWQGKLNSISALSPSMPTLPILCGLPYAYPVQVHSIIGNRGRPGPLEQSSDGVVPYGSSHLDGVASELIVPTGHSAFRDPQALAEIERILTLP